MLTHATTLNHSAKTYTDTVRLNQPVTIGAQTIPINFGMTITSKMLRKEGKAVLLYLIEILTESKKNIESQAVKIQTIWSVCSAGKLSFTDRSQSRPRVNM